MALMRVIEQDDDVDINFDSDLEDEQVAEILGTSEPVLIQRVAPPSVQFKLAQGILDRVGPDTLQRNTPQDRPAAVIASDQAAKPKRRPSLTLSRFDDPKSSFNSDKSFFVGTAFVSLTRYISYVQTYLRNGGDKKIFKLTVNEYMGLRAGVADERVGHCEFFLPAYLPDTTEGRKTLYDNLRPTLETEFRSLRINSVHGCAFVNRTWNESSRDWIFVTWPCTYYEMMVAHGMCDEYAKRKFDKRGLFFAVLNEFGIRLLNVLGGADRIREHVMCSHATAAILSYVFNVTINASRYHVMPSDIYAALCTKRDELQCQFTLAAAHIANVNDDEKQMRQRLEQEMKRQLDEQGRWWHRWDEKRRSIEWENVYSAIADVERA